MSDRVILLRRFFNLASMQVCAAANATDAEILEFCNRRYPSGTTHGWHLVLRTADESSPFTSANKLPVPCDGDPGRAHFIVIC